ncbi:MAG: V-type ATP synthase subunit E [Anaerorhabdus sp.]
MDEKKELLLGLEKDMMEQYVLIENQINEEVKVLQEKHLLQFEESLNKEIETYKEKELNEIKRESAVLTSKGKLKTQRELLKMRKTMVDKFFNEIIEDVKDVVCSDYYKEYLKKEIEKVSIKDCIIKARKEDIDLIKGFVNDKSVEIIENNIILGGFKVYNKSKGIEVDNTIDVKVKKQREWFESHSGLII